MDIGQILDLERYPIDRPASAAGRALVAQCRDTLERDGLFNLEGFVRPAALRRAAAELAPAMATQSFLQSRRHNIYFLPSIPGVPDDHPALAHSETSNHTLAADQIAESVVMAIYEWLPLAAFLAATTGAPRLFLMADPLARVNVMAYRAGQALGWHFDRSEFTTTLLLQAPEAGGQFQYRRDLRSADDANLDGVARVVSDRDPQVRGLALDGGTLNVFRGRNTAHRVTPVTGERARMIAVFAYFHRPDVMFSNEERLGFYGRAE